MPIPHPGRLWAGNGFERYRSPRRGRVRRYLTLAGLMLWCWLAVYGAVALIREVI